MTKLNPLLTAMLGPGGHLYFKVDIIRVKRLLKSTLNTIFFQV